MNWQWESLGAERTEDGEWEWRYDLTEAPWGSAASAIVTELGWEPSAPWEVALWEPPGGTHRFADEHAALCWVRELQQLSVAA